MAKRRRNACAVARDILSKGSQKKREIVDGETKKDARTVDSILREGDPNVSVGLYRALNRQPVFYNFW